MRIFIAPQPLELSLAHERKRCVVKARGWRQSKQAALG
jgi:hypothetical protein